jgi:hypothetical protein
MLIGPCALTMAGAATVAAAPAAATFKKRRRVEVVSLVVMVFSPLDAVLGGPALIYWPQDKGLRAVLATMIATMRRFDAACNGKSIYRASWFIPFTRIFFSIGMNRFRLKE